MIKLRGHHIFCLVGFRGMGYSKEYAENMTKVHQQIRSNPKTSIQIINGPDCLCEKFPKFGEYHCENKNIYVRDEEILKLLNLHIGDIVSWEEIENRIKNYASSTIINTVCETCSWRSFGVCEEGLKNICEGKGLVEIN